MDHKLFKNGNFKNGSASELYKSFIKWIENNKEDSAKTTLTQTAFGLLLSNANNCIDYNLGSE